MAVAEKWYRVENTRAFMEARGVRSVGVHSPKHIKRIPWPVCSRCGLLYLKNEATAREVRKACVVEE
jgi:hypothetical protein